MVAAGAASGAGMPCRAIHPFAPPWSSGPGGPFVQGPTSLRGARPNHARQGTPAPPASSATSLHLLSEVAPQRDLARPFLAGFRRSRGREKREIEEK